MDEVMVNNEITSFIEAVKGLADITNEEITDDVLELMTNVVKQQFSEAAMQQAINQIIQNLEIQGQTKAEAKQAVESLKNYINEQLYGGEVAPTGNKKTLLDSLTGEIYKIFDLAVDKYHSYAIELPMTLDAGAHEPTYAHETDAAADLYALEDTTLEPCSLGNKIRTGVKIQLPEGWQAFILPRSSIGAKTPLRLSNSVGLIDSGYRGELGVLYDNIGDDPYEIHAGDRIAQLLVMPSYRFKAEVVDVLADSDRSTSGFGSTGK